MNEGAWIEVVNGRWHWIQDDHADWIRRPRCACEAGLSLDEALYLAAMPRRQRNGADRHAILLEAMRHKLIRFRGHGAYVTFESTLPVEDAIKAAAPFMAAFLGPWTYVRFNQLPDGPNVTAHYKELKERLEAKSHSPP